MRKKYKIANKRFFAILSVLALSVIFVPAAFAATSDPITIMDNLLDFVLDMVRAVGVFVLIWGFVQLGMSFQSHDPSQRSTSILLIVGGLIIFFSKEILTLIGVSF